jgi:hypothetical protein
MLSAMDKRTQQEYISWRAEELARSGLFPSWVEIVRQLRAEGAYCAHEELTAPFTRWRLNRLCDASRPEEGDKETSCEPKSESTA